jgi:hypothetical protein
MAPHLNIDPSPSSTGNPNSGHSESIPPSPEAYLNSFLDSFIDRDDLNDQSTVRSQQSPSSRNGASRNGAPHEAQTLRDTNESPTKRTDDEYQEPIAIVGLAFQFPGGVITEDDFWDMMAEKKCLSTDFPTDRINIDAFYSPDDKKKNTVSLIMTCWQYTPLTEYRFTPGKDTSSKMTYTNSMQLSSQYPLQRPLLWIPVNEVFWRRPTMLLRALASVSQRSRVPTHQCTLAVSLMTI